MHLPMKLLLVEPDHELGTQLQRILMQEEYIVDWLQDGTAAWNWLENQAAQYTLAIFNWMMPGLTALELCDRVRARYSLPMVVVTAKGRWRDGVTALNAGADDYLVQPIRKQELLARLRALRRRSPHYQPLRLQFGNLTLDCDNRNVYWDCHSSEHHPVRLSKKEFQVLEYLMRHSRQEATRDQLFNYLYEVESERISNVVAAQIRRLRHKLADLGCEDMIETVEGGRYRLNPVYIDLPKN